MESWTYSEITKAAEDRITDYVNFSKTDPGTKDIVRCGAQGVHALWFGLVHNKTNTSDESNAFLRDSKRLQDLVDSIPWDSTVRGGSDEER